ncbi:MAG: hypothetical protein ABL984_02965 [Pyrinomonadaceae bacterium]
MTIKFNRFFAIIMAGLFAVILTGSAQAQWTVVGQPTYDNDNNLISLTEKHRNGNIRIMRRQFYDGTHIKMREQVKTVRANGLMLTEVIERRDRLNRVTYQSNVFLNNVRVWQGYRQTIRYRDNRDTHGINSGEKWNANTGRWVRA